MDAGCILVTGGAGFIGSCFVRMRLADTTYRVVNLDKLTYAGHLANLRDVATERRHVFVEGDVGDRELISKLLARHRPRAIAHFAAESHVDRSIDGPAAFLQTNVAGTVQLLEAMLDYWRLLTPDAQQAFRFLHVSTDEVYGPAQDETFFREDDRYRPTSPYAASKAAADHFALAFGRTYGLPVLVTHCTNNYGPYQYPEKLIPLMIRMAASGEPLPVYGDGLQVRDWLYVEDHCEAIALVLERGRPGEVYHVGGKELRTNLDVVRQICRLVDVAQSNGAARPSESRITFVEDRPAHDRRYALDCRKIALQLGWRPRTRFDNGLVMTVDWYLKNADWVAEVADGRYDFGRLGLSA